ncbi:Rieske (2Fe-2S) protein [Aestuariimicrobium kwangyangense]|uniref:Rieske (2Fe-2S) protein n=1 Tax=Aestuariimicrobium kwangyangense TaxID=396389 RepID=UPI0003B5B358|nr:Rieske (2Fe-2S) protein [Aestuariimicrobium kwangyangense]
MELTRRGLVAAATCTACGLAACGTDTAAPTPGASSTDASGRPTRASSEPTKSLATSSGGTVQGGKNIPKSSIPVGGGIILTDAQIVVTQPTRGDFKAFTSICTHQGCPVTAVEGGQIACNCHGSRFSITDGSVVRGPATQPLASEPFTDNGDQITLG